MRLALFDTFVRTNARPNDDESSFEFLNRAAGPFWERVRQLADAWFVEYPDGEDARDLRERFRGREWGEHIGAWWELYLYTLFRRLGYDIDIHPKLANVTRRPDFGIVTDGEPILLEARHVQSGLVSSGGSAGRDGWITSPLNGLTHPRFMVGVRILDRGERQPRRDAVTAGVLDWLNSLDPDALIGQQIAAMPRIERRAGEWRFELRAIPVTARATATDRGLVGLYPSLGGWDNTMAALKAALKEKARRYGRPGVPLILAPLMTSGSTNTEDIVGALFGTEAVQFSPNDPTTTRLIRRGDGFWIAGDGYRGTRVSAVLVATAIYPWNAAGPLPRLWLHPSPAHPLPSTFGLPTARITDGNLVLSTDDRTGSNLFDLPANWPGPEPAFP
ncbi:MAG TPA: hypothetical protein VI318_11685 [Baekduia sp.]